MMKEFKIKENGFAEIKKQMLKRSIPLMAIVLLLIVSITYFGSVNPDKTAEINILPYYIPLVIIVLGFGIYRGIKRQRVVFESYRLLLSENMIIRKQNNTPTIEIYLNDITEIVKKRNGIITVRSEKENDIILIPLQLENREELEESLNQVKPFTSHASEPAIQKYNGLLSLLSVGLMAAVYISNNKIVVGICGTLLAGLLSWSFYNMRKSKNIDSKTKRSAWWVLLVLASIISITIMKLTGHYS